MSWWGSFEIYGEDGEVIVNVRCQLDMLKHVNELIDRLVEAKNNAFLSGAAEHRLKMEELEAESCTKSTE